MLLSDILRKLGHSEIASYFAGSEIAEGIGEKYWPQMIDYINTGLTKLHTKFPLSQIQLVIQQYEHIATYTLSSKYAESNTDSTEPYKYIKDSVFEPFEDNVIRIERVYNECYEELPINERHDCCSVFTPAYNKIQVPTPEKENAIFVVYRANHKKIPVTVEDPSTVEIHLPDTLEEALLAYIGHIYLSSKNTEVTSNLASRLYAKYLSICNEADNTDLLLQGHGGINVHPCIQGWI